jgi:hypothetical protein
MSNSNLSCMNKSCCRFSNTRRDIQTKPSSRRRHIQLKHEMFHEMVVKLLNNLSLYILFFDPFKLLTMGECLGTS